MIVLVPSDKTRLLLLATIGQIDFLDRLRDGWNGFLNVVVALATLWPLGATIGGFVAIARLLLRRRPSN